MEIIRYDSKLNKLRDISRWKWLARVIPSLYTVSTLFYFSISHETLSQQAVLIWMIILSSFIIVWWWWVMDTIQYLISLYKDADVSYLTIISELKDVKKEILSKSNQDGSDRKRGKQKNH